MHACDDFSAIESLDLDPIKAKLMHEKGKGWSLARANAAEREYRRFLYLAKKFPNEPTAPLVDVDEFWHYHILDTKKYAADCESVFGYFLHHFPYAGMRGAEDEKALMRMSTRTRALYEETFQEHYAAGLLAVAGKAGTAFSSPTQLATAYGPRRKSSAYRVETDVTDASDNARREVELAGCDMDARAAAAWCVVPSTAPLNSMEAATAWCVVPSTAPMKDTATAASAAWCVVPSTAPQKEMSGSSSGATAWCVLETAPRTAKVSPRPASHEALPEHQIGYYLERPRLPS